MAANKSNPDYLSEIKKLVDQKVISEKTAQIHLSDLNSYTYSKADQPVQKRSAKINIPRVIALILIIGLITWITITFI